jgi:hypothetical protein
MRALERTAQPITPAAAVDQAPPPAAPALGETDELQTFINQVTERLAATRAILITRT